MPDDEPEPRLEISWRAAWLTGLVVLAALLGVAAWVLGSSRGTPTLSPAGAPSGPTVVTAPTSPAPTSTAPPGHRRHHLVRDPLTPVRIHRDPGCPIRPPTLVRVMQFNIHAGVSRFGGVGIARIAAEIRAAHPDLVSLNEVDDGTIRSGRTDEPAYLGAATGLHAVYGPNLFGYDGGRFGNAILSRFPITSTHNTRLPGAAHDEPRGLLEATVRIGHRDISFYSVHLTQGVRGAGLRVRQAEAVARVVRSATGPTVLSGDLNSGPADLPVRILRQYLLDAQQYGGRGAGLTVPEAAPRNRIDYILYDNHFAVLPGSTQVVPSGSSDHRSVWTELVLRPRGQC